MTGTLLTGSMNPLTGIFAMLFSLGLSISYQFIRHHLNYQSFGEQLIQSTDKKEILKQDKIFSISRIPLFILILLTLAISGNILDGLSEGEIYSIGSIFLFGLLTGCTYYGMKNFSLSTDLVPTFLIAFGLALTAFAFKYSSKAQLTGDFLFNVYLGFSVLWIVMGLIYRMKRIK